MLGMKIRNLPVLKRLFRQYEEGTLHPLEKKVIDDWFESHQDHAIADPLLDKETEQRIYRELTERIRQGMAPVPVRRLWRSSVWLKAACATGALFILAALYQYNRSPVIRPQQQLAYQTITTANAQVRKIILEDSTEIWLNAATTIRFALSKNDTARTVYLDKGEAFFKVKHDPARTFRVISGQMITRDIGTAFNIRAYDPEKEYRVAVSYGEVAISRLDHTGKLQVISAGLVGGQSLSYDLSTTKTQTGKKDVELSSSWRTGKTIYLDAMTLKQIGEELARKYNVRVNVTDPGMDPNHYTFHLENESLARVLEQLTVSTGISYSLDHNHLTINPADKR